MNLNKVFIIGRVTSDIVLKATASNQAVTNFSVATNRTWTDKGGSRQDETQFHSVVVWGRQAEIASQFLAKGSLVMIEGRLQTRAWKGTDGQSHRTTEIVCEQLQLGPRSANAGASSSPRPAQSRPSSPAPSTQDDSDMGFSDSLEEDIPDISLDEGEIKPEDLPF